METVTTRVCEPGFACPAAAHKRLFSSGGVAREGLKIRRVVIAVLTGFESRLFERTGTTTS
jgi:hypothetical protein